MNPIMSAARNRGRIARFLFASLISASFLAPQAKAAAFKDGATTTIDGTIHKVLQVDKGFEFFIEDDSLEGSRVYIFSKTKQSCRLFSRIHATGKILRPVMGTDHVDWHLTHAAFSCQQPINP